MLRYAYIYFGLHNWVNQNIMPPSFTYVHLLLLFLDNKIFAAYADSCLLIHTLSKSKMDAMGLQNGQLGLKTVLLLGFWALQSTFDK